MPGRLSPVPMIPNSLVMPSIELFPGYGQSSYVPLSPVAVGELPPALCNAAYDEFDQTVIDLSRCAPRCELADLDPRLIAKAIEVYKKCPYVINCAYRSVEWDKSKGRSGSSSHCKGLAMDIKAVEHRFRLNLITALIECGVRRIGIAKTFIHFDVDPDKAPSMWLYHPDNVNKMY